MAEYVLPWVDVVGFGSPSPVAFAGSPALTFRDGSDDTRVELRWAFTDTANQNFVRVFVDGSALPEGATITGMKWRIRYDHNYGGGWIPETTTLRVLEMVNYEMSVSPVLPEVGGWTGPYEWDVPAGQWAALTAAALRASTVQLQITRTNSMEDSQPIRVSEAALVVQADDAPPPDPEPEPVIESDLLESRRRFTA